MKIYFILCFIIFLRGVISYILSRKHFLLILIRLEAIMLGVYLGLFTRLSINIFNIFYIMIFLTIAVCEGVLGLSTIVLIVRISGSDNILNLSFLW